MTHDTRVRIVPTVLANSTDDFHRRLERLLPIADELQVDIMDGRFVPSQSISVHHIPDLRHWPSKRFEAHLMVDSPGAYIQPLAQRGFSRVIFHFEAVSDVEIRHLLALCAKHRIKPVLAINPETPEACLLPYMNDFDGVLFMGVHPGFNGAPYVKDTPAKIASFAKRNTNPSLVIQVDGGMTPETIGGVVAAGATRINTGSFVSNAANPALAMQALRDAAGVPPPIMHITHPVPTTQTGEMAAKKNALSTKKRKSPARKPTTRSRSTTARKKKSVAERESIAKKTAKPKTAKKKR